MDLIQLLRKYAGVEDLQGKGELEDSDIHNLGLDLPTSVANWPDEWREAFEERAAFLEHEGGLSRDEAEREAEMRQREEYIRQKQSAQNRQGEV